MKMRVPALLKQDLQQTPGRIVLMFGGAQAEVLVLVFVLGVSVRRFFD